MAADPSFGSTIRAYRLGWGLSQQHGCFIRMSDASGLNSTIELCPINAVPTHKTANRLHRVWWDNPAILGHIPWLSMVKRVKRYICVTVDNNGNIIKEDAK